MSYQSDTDTVSLYEYTGIIGGVYINFCFKVLADHMKQALMHIGTFVAKRQILGVILIANELIDSRKHIRVDGAIFKINLEKCTIL